MQKSPVTWGISDGGGTLLRWGHPLKSGGACVYVLYAVSSVISLTKNFVPTPTLKSRVDSRRSPLVREKITMQIHLNLPGAPLVENTLFLMAQSDTHRFYNDRDIERLILAPRDHGKLLVAYDDVANPIGFSTHAFLSPEAEEGYLTRSRRLQPIDFEGEDGNLWYIDFAAPFGNCIHIIRVMRNWHDERYGPGMKARIYRGLRNHIGSIRI